MSLAVPNDLEGRIDELMTHYPQPRSASLMVLHALQEHFGWLSSEAVEWAAAKLRLQPINIYELVTFYPMFRQEPVGRHHIRICRTLSCALGGATGLHRHICGRLGLDPGKSGLQVSADGQVSVEFVECLAGCGAAPVLMVDDRFAEGVTVEMADAMLQELKDRP